VKYFVIFMVLGAIATPFVGAAIDAQVCAYRWSGFTTQHSLLSGCKVEIDGKFVPEDRVRFGE
jgi:hypothetical protein